MRNPRRERSILIAVATTALLAALPALPASVAGIASGGPRSPSVGYFANWTELPPGAGPGNLSEFGWTWVDNGTHGFGLLFGGRNGSSQLADATWVYQAGTWTQLHLAVHPSARRGPMMVYDVRHSEVVLFGGSNATAYLNDTWSYAHGVWVQLHPTRAPTARRVGGFAYDARGGYDLLFGGHRGGLTGSYVQLSDTWKFLNGQWYHLYPNGAPGPHSELSLAYDGAAKVVVLFGGYERVNRTYVAYNSTWYWSGRNWTELNLSVAPAARDGAVFAYDDHLHGLVLEGGHYDSQNASAREFNDTWALLGASGSALRWVPVVTAAAPPAADAAGMLFDTHHHELVLFGGRTGLPTARWFDATWTVRIP